MEDVVLVTIESLRKDFTDEMEFLSSHDIVEASTVGHYTRPSTSAILSSSYRASLETRPVSPTLPQVLSDDGYTCMAFAPGPQVLPSMGFDDGFDLYEDFFDREFDPFENRTTKLREVLGSFEIVRRIYRRFFPQGA
ncbi:MAG: sulfatase, partial [Candidatus Nanohaloarchaea archaeon]|nr:sulfatase [Candidatus Nanohaloarchaea archaeon]